MTFRSAIRPLALAGAAILLPTAALAHVGVGPTSGFVHGFGHPVGGLDHMLAMAMVGVFAWQLGGRALWLVPATFVTVMAVGGALGFAGMGVPHIETAIALSVVALGAIVAFGMKAPVAAAMGIVGLFAIFHGHAHGTEVPVHAGGLAYAAGFMLATALLHVVGIGIGFLVGRASESHGATVMRSAGAIAAIAGVGLLTGLL